MIHMSTNRSLVRGLLYHHQVDSWISSVFDLIKQFMINVNDQSNVMIYYSQPLSLILLIMVALSRTQPRNPAPCLLWTFLEFQMLIEMESILLRKLDSTIIIVCLTLPFKYIMQTEATTILNTLPLHPSILVPILTVLQ